MSCKRQDVCTSDTGTSTGSRSSCKLKQRIHLQSSPYNRNSNNSVCTSSGTSSSSDESCGEIEFNSGDGTVAVPKKQKRNAANMRERNRMHVVNFAFDRLREVVPSYPGNRKLSKIETLRMACTYIKELGDVLKTNGVVQGDEVPAANTQYSVADSPTMASSTSLADSGYHDYKVPPPAYPEHSSSETSPSQNSCPEPDSPYYQTMCSRFQSSRPPFSRTYSDSVIMQQPLGLRHNVCQPNYVTSPSNGNFHQVCSVPALTRIGSDPYWGNSVV